MHSSSPVWHPFTQMKGIPGFPEVRSGRGARLTLADGNQLIDAISSWWVITHGHCEPAIVAAIQKQAEILDQVIFAGFTHDRAEWLARELVRITPPDLNHVFFSDDGSTAVEVALKMALQSCQQRGMPERNMFLAFEAAYHGDTVGAMSVGGESVFTDAFRQMMFAVKHAKHPSRSDAEPADYTADFHRLVEQHGDQLAGVIVEPLIQGAGGMIVWPEAAVREIVDTCRERGILVIFDEIMTGFGRTGATFAAEKLGVAPDLMCLSKGLTGGTLPLSVTMATSPIFESFLSNDRAKTFFHGHSFTANPITCAAACANLEIMASRDMAGQWRAIEAEHRRQLDALADHPRVDDRRLCGTVAAVSVTGPDDGYLADVGPRLYRYANDNGVLLRPLGNVLYMMPPYGIETADLKRAWQVFRAALDHLDN